MKRSGQIIVEACVDTLASAVLAEQGGANRIELCADLSDAGTTPSLGVLELALDKLAIPVFPIIRPRGGSFVYDEFDSAVARRDLAHARDAGAHGAVIGALTAEGDIDQAEVGLLRDLAPAMELTFHRAFDVCRDPHQALDTLIALGINRVLTSGQGVSAEAGIDLIATLVQQAAGRIVIMAGGGVNEENVREIVDRTGVKEVHVRSATLRRDAVFTRGVPFRKPPPRDELARGVTDPARLALVRSALD